MHPAVFGYATTVFVFWWIVLGIWGVFKGGIQLTGALQSSISILILCSVGSLLGVIGKLAWVILEKQSRQDGLKAMRVRGLSCSIGEVPLNAKQPERSDVLPSFIGVPDVPADFYPLWIKHYSDSHPEHVALLVAMLLVYEKNKALPATHVVGGHGGRTLLQHSLLVAYQMQTLATKWSYSGLRDRTGKKVLLKLRDDGYEFNPMDPLVMIVGLAHDIGKIEAFIFEDGKIVGSHHEHDLTGARMLSRMPEMWSIPDADRQALLLAIAHYHHPMELPLSPDRRAIDDRTIAVMELLIKADFVASAIERKGVVPTEGDYLQQMDALQHSELTDETIWDAFKEILEETGRINSTDFNYNVGTICQVTGQNSMRLVLKEDAIRGAMMRRLGITDATALGDGRYQLTVKLLTLIDHHGFLVKKSNSLEYSAGSALWVVGFYGKKKAKGKNEADRLGGWDATIIVQTSISPYIAKLTSYPWVAHVERGTMGSARAKSKASSPESSNANEPETLAIPTEIESGDPDPVPGTPTEDVPPVADLPTPENRTESPTKIVSKQHQGQRKSKQDSGSRLAAVEEAAMLMQTPKQPADASPAVEQPVDVATSSQTNEALDPVVLKEVADPTFTERFTSIESFIVPVAAQRLTDDVPQISPRFLKQSVATVITNEPVGMVETLDGRIVYVVTRLQLIKHLPGINWSQASSVIVALCNTVRGEGFTTVEASGELYIAVDALMIKSFMERDTPVAATENQSTITPQATDTDPDKTP